MESSLRVRIASLDFPNPILLASGILGISADVIKRVVDAGAGGVVTKSISLLPRRGYSNPTVVPLEYGLLNAIGLANPGVEKFLHELKKLRGIKVPIIVSVVGENAYEYGEIARILDRENSVSAIELNISCPHEGGVHEISVNPSLTYEVVREAVKNCSKPIIVKLSPNVVDIAEIGRAAEEAGASAVTAINTVRAMAINIETGKPVLSSKIGGLSGPAIKPIAIRCVYQLYESVGIPIIGCGGISSWRDVVEFLLAGASAVQIGSIIAQKGVGVFEELLSGLRAFLANRGISEVKELVGLSHEN